jgi:hypothetical protein
MSDSCSFILYHNVVHWVLSSSNGKKKTVLKTIRITQELDNLLQKDAKAKGLNVNAYINSIFTKHTEWDRFVEKFGGLISMRHETLKSILDLIPDNDSISKIAYDASNRIPKEFLLLWFKKIDVDSYIQQLHLVCRYAGWAELEVDRQEDGQYIATLIHNAGEKWSYWLQGAIEGGMRNTIGISPKCEISETSLIVRFSVP